MGRRVSRLWGAVAAGAVAVSLAACSPAESPEPEPEPSVEPSPTAASPSPSPTSEPIVLRIPGSCDELIDADLVQRQFGADFVPIEMDPAHPMGAQYRVRGGLACVWGIPQSDAGVFVGVAEADASDAELVAQWQAEGYTEGPDFLDETWVLREGTELGPQITVKVLVEGFEITASTSGTEPDGLLVIVRDATDNMGYL